MVTLKHRQVFPVLLGLVVLLGGVSGLAQADIYTYVDSEGVMHFTNTPTSSDYRLFIREDRSEPGARIGNPLSNRYDAIITRASEQHGIAFPLIKALIKVESDFDPLAVSPTGAKGLMQIMPDNVRALRIGDPFNPAENIMGGVRYLRRMLDRFDEKLPLALAAYNAGPGAVEHYRRIPPFRETEAFVEKVMTYYNLLKKG